MRQLCTSLKIIIMTSELPWSYLSLVSSLVLSVDPPMKGIPEFTASGHLQCTTVSRAACVLTNTENSGRSHGHVGTRQPVVTDTGSGL